MAGRRPKPLAIHQLNGNPRHFSKADLTGSDNPTPDLEEPEMPKGLSKAARREWRRIVPLLLEIKVLSKVDGLALAAYCRCAGDVEALSKLIAADGYTYRAMYENELGVMVPGDMKANPAVSLYNTAMKNMKSFLIEFGLTPASRSKLKIEKAGAGDETETYLKSKPASGKPFGFTAPAGPANRSSIDAVGSDETVVNPYGRTEADQAKS